MTARSAVLLVVVLLLGACGSPGSGAVAPSPAKATATSKATTTSLTSWQERRPTGYSFVLDSRCGERALIGRFAIRVRGNQVTGVEGLDDAGRAMIHAGLTDQVPSLDGLLSAVDDARQGNAFRADVVLDPTDGHPTKIDIDGDENAIDDEQCYVISAYSPN